VGWLPPSSPHPLVAAQRAALWKLQAIEDDSLPLIFEPVGGDSARLESSFLTLGGFGSAPLTEFRWTASFDRPPGGPPSEVKTGRSITKIRDGGWRLEEESLFLEYQDGTVDTGRVVSYVPRDRRALGDTLTLILRSFGSDWVYELRIRGDP